MPYLIQVFLSAIVFFGIDPVLARHSSSYSVATNHRYSDDSDLVEHPTHLPVQNHHYALATTLQIGVVEQYIPFLFLRSVRKLPLSRLLPVRYHPPMADLGDQRT